MADQSHAAKVKTAKTADSVASMASARPPRGDDGTPRKKESGPDLAGSTLGDFLILRRIGSGGMGEVYLAQQVSLKRQVALKVLRSRLMEDDTAQKRFAIEAEAAAKLTHPNIVQIYAYDDGQQQNGIAYMALEYVQGMNLRDFVLKKGPTNPRLAVRVMEQVAAALHHAAEAGVIHRDIKPDNILLTRKGEVKVADFGLSRIRAERPVSLTQTGVTMGTPLYMSPEQVEGKPIDARTDLYSLGVTGYFMLAGEPPYSGETAMAVALQHLRGEAKPLEELRPDLPAALAAVVKKLMAKNPDERYQTGRQLARDLHKLKPDLAPAEPGDESPAVDTSGAAMASMVESTAPRESLAMRVFSPAALRRRWAWWFAATIVLSLAGGAAYGFFQRAPDLRPRPGNVPPKSTAVRWEDIFEMKTAESQFRFALAVGQFDKDNPEAAWLAVINRFPLEGDWVFKAKLQLGRHYLDERQLDKAEKHFGEMAADSDSRTQLAGEVGKAAVLCLQDRPQESLAKLLTVIDARGVPDSDRALLGLAMWTIERNYRNMGTEWAPEFRKWANQKLWAPGTRPQQPPGRTPGG